MGFDVKTALKKAFKSARKKELLPIDNVVSAERSLEGKVALVAGGSGGIGMATAEALLEAGAKVVLGGTRQEKLDSCVVKLGHSDCVASVILDVTDAESLQCAVIQAAGAFGGIDIHPVLRIVRGTGGIDFADFGSLRQGFDKLVRLFLESGDVSARLVLQIKLETVSHAVPGNHRRRHGEHRGIGNI